jgi:TRAP-type C4-dicarboxylate transport system substrate-binding protein
MKKSALLCLAVMFGFALTTAPVEGASNLRFQSGYMDTHPTVVNGFLPWFEEIKKATQDQINIRNFNPNTICPEGEIYAATVKGLIDMGGANHNRVPGKFPLHEVFSLPLIANSSESMSETIKTISSEFPAVRKEMDETILFGYWASAPHQIHTVNKQVKTLEDLKGLRILVWAKPNADMVAAFGGNPITVAPPESYLALSRHQADGIMCPLAPFRSMKINEATKYTTIGNFFEEPFYMAMNKGVWQRFPEEVKKQFLSTVTSDWCNRIGRTLDVGAAADVKWLQEKGHTFYTLPQEELNRWQATVKPMKEAWVKKIVDLKVLSEDDARALLKRTEEVGAAVTARLGAAKQ